MRKAVAAGGRGTGEGVGGGWWVAAAEGVDVVPLGGSGRVGGSATTSIAATAGARRVGVTEVRGEGRGIAEQFRRPALVGGAVRSQRQQQKRGYERKRKKVVAPREQSSSGTGGTALRRDGVETRRTAVTSNVIARTS